MYIKAAVCDDEVEVQFAIEEYLQNICKDRAIDVEVECYGSGETLCRNFQRGKYDLIFLDIEYEGMNGVAIGKYIRETAGDELVQIAYISGNTGYAMELFEYRPINFLVKPVSQNEIERIIDKYLILSNQKVEKFHYKVGSKMMQESLADILYFSSSARKVTLHKRNETTEFYGSLEQVYAQVKNNRFLYVHKSYIVNYQYIKKMEYEQTTLTDGSVIPISQSRRTAVRKQFLEIKKRDM